MGKILDFFKKIKCSHNTELDLQQNRPVALGVNTSASKPYECAIGKYNFPVKNLLFSVGNGYDNDNRRNSVAVIADRPSLYVWGIGEYDGQNTENAFDLQTVLSNLFINYIQSYGPCSKRELAKKLKIPESGIDLLLNGGTRSIRFQYNGYILTFPYAGGAVIGDEVDSYAIYELTPTAGSIMNISYYGTFMIHKNECETYDCKFIIDTYNY